LEVKDLSTGSDWYSLRETIWICVIYIFI
jgi:hypothetical protein